MARRLRWEERGLFGKLARLHWPTLVLVAAISALGLATLWTLSAGGTRIGGLFDRQTTRLAIGFLALLVIALLPFKLWMALSWPLYGLAIALLGMVAVAGAERMGARRWLDLGGLGFQPSEIAKIALVLALARYYHWLPRAKVSHPVWVGIPALVVALPMLLTLRQPDLGTAVLLAIIGLSIMLLAGVSLLYFAAGAAVLAGGAPLVWAQLHDYQRRRVATFLDLESDPLGAGYHIIQSKIAIGSGGYFGKGWLEGTQSRLRFLPEAHTDFIFPAFAEQAGFIGSLTLLVLYGLLLAALASVAVRCTSRFARLMVGGVTTALFAYIAVNLAMVSGLAPVVGVPLPLFSYGGTALVTAMAGLGLVMSAWINRDVHVPDPSRESRL
jgi:rod shape determining protein RodA